MKTKGRRTSQNAQDAKGRPLKKDRLSFQKAAVFATEARLRTRPKKEDAFPTMLDNVDRKGKELIGRKRSGRLIPTLVRSRSKKKKI